MFLNRFFCASRDGRRILRPNQRKFLLQPARIARFQLSVISHDEDRMYEVLQGFNWTFEKVLLPLTLAFQTYAPEALSTAEVTRFFIRREMHIIGCLC